MQGLKAKLILSLGLVMAMYSVVPAASGFTLQRPVTRLQPGLHPAIIEAESVTKAEVSHAAAEQCAWVQTTNRDVVAQCVDTLVSCVLGQNNRFGCHAKNDGSEEFECDLQNGLQYTVETMVSKCHEYPNPTNYTPQTAVAPDDNDTLSPNVRPEPIDRDPEPRYGAPNLHHVPSYGPIQTGVESTGPTLIDRISTEILSDRAIHEVEGLDENVDVNHGGDDAADQGSGCSLSAGSEPFSLLVWIPNLMLALAPLIWAMCKRK